MQFNFFSRPFLEGFGFCRLVMIIIICLIPSTPAFAEKGLNLAGMEFARKNSYFYIGRIQTAGNSLGSGILYRFWLDAGNYEYNKLNTTIEARFSRLSGAVGYQNSNSQGWWGSYFGLAYQDTSLAPDDSENSSRGGKTSAFVQIEAETLLSPQWRLNGGGNYTLARHAYWLRGRIFRSLENMQRLGGEIVVHGDPNYRATQIGGIFEIPLALHNKALLKAGIRTTAADSASGYAGIELTQSF